MGFSPPRPGAASGGGLKPTLRRRPLLRRYNGLLHILRTLATHSEIIKLQQGVIDHLRSRLDKLEGCEDIIVAKFEAAAIRVTADFAAKIGRIERIVEVRNGRE